MDMSQQTRLKAGEFNTDKSQAYLDNYESWFSRLRDKKVAVLELGVLDGGSLIMWSKYFKKGTIVGLDINDIRLPSSYKNIKVYKGLQQDYTLLQKMFQETAPKGFDIIIDDASHLGEQTSLSFKYLFNNCLRPSGIYVVEDWGTGYWSTYPDGKKFDNRKSAVGKVGRRGKFPSHEYGMVGFVKQLVDEQGMRDITSSFGVPPFRQSMFNKMIICPGQVAVFKT